MSKAHEFVVFNFKDGTELNVQKELMKKIDACANKLDGFVKRDYYYSPDTQKWIDHVVWESHEYAKKAGDAIMTDQDALSVFQHIEEKTMVMSHFDLMN